LKISTEFKIGFFIIVAIIVAYWGINYLKGNDVFKKERIYFAVYDRIDGLAPSNVISINGFPIGLVRHIYLLPERGNKILVEFAITNPEIKIPRDSEVRIFSSDLLGSKQVSLTIGYSADFAESGDTLTASIEAGLAASVNAQIAPLKMKAEELLGQIEKAVITVQSVFDESARDNLSQSFESVKESFYSLSLTAKRIDSLIAYEKPVIEKSMDNLSSFIENLNNNNENLNAFTSNLVEISDSLKTSELKEAIANASIALEQFTIMMDKASRGEGTIGKLIHDDSLYNSMTDASVQLASLLEDMETNPDRYVQVSVFGKKEKKLKLSNKDIERVKEAMKEEEEENQNK
jgi:phospholipid/cholesterol/gamma-HCH transport system substrate-binding protein